MKYLFAVLFVWILVVSSCSLGFSRRQPHRQKHLSTKERSTRSKSFHDHPTCPSKKDEVKSGRKCQKKCLVDKDCRGSRRQCKCDGACGLTCIRTGMQCNRLENVTDGIFNLVPNNSFRAVARYSCNDGYILRGKTERVCQGDRRWSGQPPKCVTEGVCGRPPNIDNAVQNMTKMAPTYKVIEKKRLRQEKDGDDDDNDDDDDSSDDDDDMKMNDVALGEPNDVAYPLGTQFVYQCNQGYKLTGNQRAMCSGEGIWVGPQMTCSPVECPFPGNVPNAQKIAMQEFYFGDKVNYMCSGGYDLEGNRQRRCLEDSTWSGSLPRCRPISCPKPIHIANGYMEGGDFSFGSAIKYHCNTGYELVGDSLRKCLKERSWSGLEPECQEIHCDPLKPSPNVYFSTTQTVFNTTVEFRCIGNSRSKDDSMKTTCNEKGEWTHGVANCYSMCIIPKPHKGELDIQDVAGSYVDHNSQLKFTCDPGNVLPEPPVCKNGTWIPDVECKPSQKSCTDTRPPELKDGFYRIHKTSHGDTAWYYCDAGYVLSGVDTIKCTDGDWGNGKITANCSKINCDHPGELDNGDILLIGVKGKFHYRPYVKNIGHNEMIEFQCYKDYKLVGPEGATCVDGNWSPQLQPQCKLRKHLIAPRLNAYSGK